MTNQSNNLGIDISKRQLDFSFGKGLHRGSEANNAHGHARIVTLCKQHPGLRVICEATGGYEKALVKALRKEGVEVHVVMPLKVKCLAIAQGLMAKTDRIDAEKLALFGEKVELKPHHMASEHEEKLRELVECRQHLSERLVQLAGRQENAGERMLKLLADQRVQVEEHKKRIEEEIKECMGQNKQTEQKLMRMTQVKGVGMVVAASVLAFMPEIGSVSDKTASALVGLAPYPNQSGARDRARRIMGGRHQLRHVLFPAALSAMCHNPILRAFNQRLKDNGKPGLVRVVAVMRKLICLLNKICADPNFSLS